MQSACAFLRRCAAALAACFALGVHAAPVALVADVVGDAQSGGEPLKLLAEMDAGREIAVAERGSVIVFTLADGAEWTLTGPGRFRVGARGPEAIAGAAAPQRRAGPAAFREIRLRSDRLQQGGLVLRGRDRLVLVAPVNEVVVVPEVRFTWEPLEDGTRYQFELVDTSGGKLLAAETTAAEIALPEAVRLQPGQVYYWGVRALGTPGSAVVYRAAEFRMADAVTRRRVEAARPRAEAPFAERVLYVALLQEVGARSAAEEARRALAAERPVAWAEPR